MSLRNLKKMKAREAVPGYFVKYVHTPNLTIAYWDIKAGSPLPEHEHPHEQVVNVIEGVFEMTMEGTRHVLEPGKVLVIPPDTKHSGWAVKNCRIIDVFYPARAEVH
jgi:quercetin dioxygenase-like cupin family protein